MQDIGGGLTTTVPAFRDWKNPEIQPFIDKYLAAKDGVLTEDRLRILRLIKDITGNHWAGGYDSWRGRWPRRRCSFTVAPIEKFQAAQARRAYGRMAG